MPFSSQGFYPSVSATAPDFVTPNNEALINFDEDFITELFKDQPLFDSTSAAISPQAQSSQLKQNDCHQFDLDSLLFDSNQPVAPAGATGSQLLSPPDEDTLHDFSQQPKPVVVAQQRPQQSAYSSFAFNSLTAASADSLSLNTPVTPAFTNFASPSANFVPSPLFNINSPFEESMSDFGSVLTHDFNLFEDGFAEYSAGSSSATPLFQQQQLEASPFVSMLPTPMLGSSDHTVTIPLADLASLLKAVQMPIFNSTFMNALATAAAAAALSSPSVGSLGEFPQTPLVSSEASFPTSSSSSLFDDEDRSHKRTKRRPHKLYPCPYDGCTRSFTRAFNLKTHEEIHNTERDRPFVCEVCKKDFVRIHDLVRHNAVHDEVKAHPCLTCGKAFARKDALSRHEKSSFGCKGASTSTM